MRTRQQGGDRPVVLEPQGANAGGAQGLQLEPGVAADLGRGAREHHGRRGAPALEPACDDESVAAVAALAAHDDDAGAATGGAERGERGRDGLGGTATGVLHEGGARDSKRGDRAPVEPPHLVGGEDAQHGG